MTLTACPACPACQARRDRGLVNEYCAAHCVSCQLHRDAGGHTSACEDHWWDDQRHRHRAGEPPSTRSRSPTYRLPPTDQPTNRPAFPNWLEPNRPRPLTTHAPSASVHSQRQANSGDEVTRTSRIAGPPPGPSPITARPATGVDPTVRSHHDNGASTTTHPVSNTHATTPARTADRPGTTPETAGTGNPRPATAATPTTITAQATATTTATTTVIR